MVLTIRDVFLRAFEASWYPCVFTTKAQGRKGSRRITISLKNQKNGVTPLIK